MSRLTPLSAFTPPKERETSFTSSRSPDVARPELGDANGGEPGALEGGRSEADKSRSLYTIRCSPIFDPLRTLALRSGCPFDNLRRRGAGDRATAETHGVGRPTANSEPGGSDAATRDRHAPARDRRP